MSLMRFHNNVPSVFDRLFEGDLFDWTNRNFSPADTTLPSVNIKENDSGFKVEVAAPGFDKSDLKISLDNGTLTISSEKTAENETKEGERFTKMEFNYQSFLRTFTLPEIADGERIQASYDNGILNVTIPKKEEAKPEPSKIIEIR